MATQADSIERDRQAALALLRPSERDLEHGLELHADAVVIESGGCRRRRALDDVVTRPGARYTRGIPRPARESSAVE